jgi:hypothetical protein
MKRRVFSGLAATILSAGIVFLQPTARAGHLPSDSVRVIPRASNPLPSSPRPSSNNPRYQAGPDSARVRSDASATRHETREQSRVGTGQRTDRASAANDRRDDAVCTNGNPKLIGIHCSGNSECDWGARCAGQPARCANTGAPCVSSAQCLVPGVCSSDLRGVSNRRIDTPAHPVPVSHNGSGTRIPPAASGGRGVARGVSSR